MITKTIFSDKGSKQFNLRRNDVLYSHSADSMLERGLIEALVVANASYETIMCSLKVWILWHSFTGRIFCSSLLMWMFFLWKPYSDKFFVNRLTLHVKLFYVSAKQFNSLRRRLVKFLFASKRIFSQQNFAKKTCFDFLHTVPCLQPMTWKFSFPSNSCRHRYGNVKPFILFFHFESSQTLSNETLRIWITPLDNLWTNLEKYLCAFSNKKESILWADLVVPTFFAKLQTKTKHSTFSFLSTSLLS